MGVAQSRKKSRKKTSKSSVAKGISQRTKVTLLVAAAAVVVIGGGWWAYFKLTTVPPPELATATTEDVVEFLVDARGYGRLSIPQREVFLVNTYQRFNTYEDRANLVRSFRRLPRSKQQRVVEKTFDVVRQITLRSAEEYRQMPKREKTKFVDQTMQRFRAMRGELGGGGDPNVDFGPAVMPHLPTTSRDVERLLINRTTPSERAKVEPFVNAIAKRHEEVKKNRR
jgi:hypothetical protein